MAKIYLKSAENTLILSPREMFQRAFSFASNWSEIRMGFFWSIISATGDNTQGPGESLTISSVLDNIAIGIKDSATQAIPGQVGSFFAGVGANTSSPAYINNPPVGIAAGGNVDALNVFGYNGVTAIAGSGNSTALLCPSDPSPATGYCGFGGVKFVLANRGGATQQFTITICRTQTVAGADYSPAALRTLMNTFASPSTPRTLAWNSGGVALPIPDAYCVRLPFFNNRIRLSCIRASQYA